MAFGDRDLLMRPLPLSIDVGVGSSPKAAPLERLFSFVPVRSPRRCACFAGCSTISVARGVGSKSCDNPHPVPPVGRIDGTSWNNKRLHFVAESFQVSAHLLEYHAPCVSKKPANVLAHDPARLNLPNCSKHLRPEVAVVVLSSLLSCIRKRLAGEPARDDVESPSELNKVSCLDVFPCVFIIEPVIQYLAAERVYFHAAHVLPSHPLRRQGEAPDAVEQVQQSHFCFLCLYLSQIFQHLVSWLCFLLQMPVPSVSSKAK